MPIEPPFTIAENKPPFLARLAGRIFTPATTTAGYVLTAAGDGTADWAAGSSGSVVSVTAGDASITVDNTDPANPTVEAGTLDQVANLHPPAANWSNNSKKITAVTAGAAAGEAAIYDQTPAGVVTTTGDTLYASAAHTIARLAVGTTSQVLGVVAGIPAWIASATSTLTTTGDMLYASAANTLARRAIGSTDQVLTVAGGLPTWAAGSKATLTTTGDLLYASGANTLARLAIGSATNVLTVSGGLPVWAAASGGGSSELNYTERTTNVAIASTTESSGTAVLSPGAVTFPGTAVLVEFFAILAQLPSAAINNQVIVSLFESTTQITRLAAANTQQTSAFDDLMLYGRYRFTPSSGSHTYSVTAFATSTTGTPTIIAGNGGTGGFPPCYVRFTTA